MIMSLYQSLCAVLIPSISGFHGSHDVIQHWRFSRPLYRRKESVSCRRNWCSAGGEWVLAARCFCTVNKAVCSSWDGCLLLCLQAWCLKFMKNRLTCDKTLCVIFLDCRFQHFNFNTGDQNNIHYLLDNFACYSVINAFTNKCRFLILYYSTELTF